MTMKRFSLWLMAALFCGSTTVQAQLKPGSFCITPKLGFLSASLTNMPDLPINETDGIKRAIFPGFLIGAECEYQLTDMFSVSAGLNYTRQGSKWQNYSRPDLGYEIRNLQTALGYVNLPIMANVYLFKGFAIRAGVQLGYLTNANTYYNITYKNWDKKWGEQPKDDEVDENIWSECNKLDLTIPLGISYDLTENITIGASYHLGLTRMNKEEDPDGDLLNRGILVTIGYRYPIDF